MGEKKEYTATQGQLARFAKALGHPARIAIMHFLALLTSVVFMSSKFYGLLLRFFFSIHSLRLRRHSASVLATVENSSPSVWR